MKKLLLMERIFEKLEQNGFHQPEWRRCYKNKFTLGGKKKNFNCQENLKNGEKKWFPLASKPVSTSQNEGFVSRIHLECLKNR